MNATSQSETIAGFMKKHLCESQSESGIAASETAKAAARHGFKNSANARYAAFLEAFRSQPKLSAEYAERYPACQFLPWSAFHAIRKSMSLSCDLPEFYAGAVPPEQVPWMDMFELNPADAPNFEDAAAMIEVEGNEKGLIQVAADPSLTYMDFNRPDLFPPGFTAAAESWWRGQESAKKTVRECYRLFCSSYFVLAPKEAFTSTEDFISRFRKALRDVTRPTIAPNDPLVFRACKGGILVVAAWGDEAAVLNETVKELKL